MSELVINWDRVNQYFSFPEINWMLVIGIVLTFLPTIIALLRNVKGGAGVGIVIVNILALISFPLIIIGLWVTIAIYIVALIWAFTARSVKEYNLIYKKS